MKNLKSNLFFFRFLLKTNKKSKDITNVVGLVRFRRKYKLTMKYKLISFLVKLYKIAQTKKNSIECESINLFKT